MNCTADFYPKPRGALGAAAAAAQTAPGVEFVRFCFGQKRNRFWDSRIRAALAQRGELGRVNQTAELVGLVVEAGCFTRCTDQCQQQRNED